MVRSVTTQRKIETYTFLENEERFSDFVVALHQDRHDAKQGPFPDSQICHKHRGYPKAAETITVTCHAAMMTTLARYVYVYLEGDDRILTLCELEVYSQRGMHLIWWNIWRNITSTGVRRPVRCDFLIWPLHFYSNIIHYSTGGFYWF